MMPRVNQTLGQLLFFACVLGIDLFKTLSQFILQTIFRSFGEKPKLQLPIFWGKC